MARFLGLRCLNGRKLLSPCHVGPWVGVIGPIALRGLQARCLTLAPNQSVPFTELGVSGTNTIDQLAIWSNNSF
jgi:hypothetical protein